MDTLEERINKKDDLTDEQKAALKTAVTKMMSDDAAKDAYNKDPDGFIDKVFSEKVAPAKAGPTNQDASTDPDADTDDTETANTPDKDEVDSLTALKLLDQQYSVIAKAFGSRFRENPNDAEALADFALKVFKSPQWEKYLNANAEKPAMIQNKIIPTLVKAYNDRNKGKEINLPKQVNDDTREDLQDRNGKTSTSIVIPEGFNKDLVELGDQAISLDLGYPMVNFNSRLIQEIIHETDKSRLKKLLSALIKKINGSKAAEAFIKSSFFERGQRSMLFKLIDQAKSAKGVPMIRRPLKVPSKDLIDNSESEKISVIPINNLGNDAVDPSKNVNEAVSLYDLSPLYEAYMSADEQKILYEGLFGQKVDTKSALKEGAPVEVPKVYLQQYYTVLLPTGASGLTRYASYISAQDKKDMIGIIGEDTVESIKASNRNVNDELIKTYLEKTDGVPPFYILIARSNPTKEKLRVCDDVKLGKNICIKSIDGKNKDAYYMDENTVNGIFEAG